MPSNNTQRAETMKLFLYSINHSKISFCWWKYEISPLDVPQIFVTSNFFFNEYYKYVIVMIIVFSPLPWVALIIAYIRISFFVCMDFCVIYDIKAKNYFPSIVVLWLCWWYRIRFLICFIHVWQLPVMLLEYSLSSVTEGIDALAFTRVVIQGQNGSHTSTNAQTGESICRSFRLAMWIMHQTFTLHHGVF